LADGSVRLNSRRADPVALRKTAVSQDGGETWSKVENVPQLPDPACMASVLRYSFAEPESSSKDHDHSRSRILYSGPAGPKRTAGTLRISYDEGRTWPLAKLLMDGNFAYSCLARLGDGSIGVLYETGDRGPYEKLKFARVPLDWIEGPVK
jgi:sialidase-1